MEENTASQRVMGRIALELAIVNGTAEERLGKQRPVDRERPQSATADRAGAALGVEHATDIGTRNEHIPPCVLWRNPSGKDQVQADGSGSLLGAADGVG